MDAVHAKAVIGLSLNPVGTWGTPGYQFLSLNNDPTKDMVEMPAIQSQAGQIAEDLLIDPIHVDPMTQKPQPLLLSPGEGLTGTCDGHDCPLCNGKLCQANYEIGEITYNPTNGNAELQLYQNNLTKNYAFPGGAPDSAAEDCNAQIALASIEGVNPSTPFTADLSKWVPVLGNPNTWTDPKSGFNPIGGLTGSILNQVSPLNTESGPIAIAQGGSHEGVLGQEVYYGLANVITAFQLSFPYNATQPFANWITCNIGTDSVTGVEFNQGFDPHTVTAYQSPNKNVDGTYHSYAVISNQINESGNGGNAFTIAVVDLDLMLKIVPPLGTYVCPGGVPAGTPGTLPANVVTFLPLCQHGSPSCPY